MEAINKNLTIVMALEYVKSGLKVKLPEWPNEHYLFVRDGHLYEENFGFEKEVTDIKDSWKVRIDWEELETINKT